MQEERGSKHHALTRAPSICCLLGVLHHKTRSRVADTVSWSSWLLWIAAGSAAPPVDFVRMGEGDKGEDGGVFDRIVIDREKPFEVRHGEEHLEELYNRCDTRWSCVNHSS